MMDFGDTNRIDICLARVREMLNEIETFTRKVEDQIARQRLDAEQTQLEVAPEDDVPEWVEVLFEALIARIPELPTAERITTPFPGWETEIHASAVAKWKVMPRHTTEEVKFALQRYSHPRVQWVRPGNVQLCRIRDAG